MVVQLAYGCRDHVVAGPRANPARDRESIEGGSRATARALQPGERDDFLAKLKADKRAAAQDLPDMVQFALATGLRIGELLAVRWGDVDLVGVEARQGDEVIRVPVVHVRGNVVRVGGQGMVRFKGKTRTAVRSVPLPPFLVTMLALRKPDDAGEDEPLFAAAGRDGGSRTGIRRTPGRRSGKREPGSLGELMRTSSLTGPTTHGSCGTPFGRPLRRTGHGRASPR